MQHLIGPSVDVARKNEQASRKSAAADVSDGAHRAGTVPADRDVSAGGFDVFIENLEITPSLRTSSQFAESSVSMM